ncbi:hypothetical protein V2A60_006177 [Cordyceps javanica]|uniref:Acetyltransferase n=1 Tax=Cordyceps javanica TaxID=43265 RepID=A0A545V8V0_9HYPO|nr:acetyltransferase [Cordyceps javanica]
MAAAAATATAASPFAREVIEIKTPRVLIRTGDDADADAYARYAADPANFPYGGAEPGMTSDKAAARLASFARWTAEGKHGWVLLRSRATGELMGYGGYNCFDRVDDAASFLAGPAATSAAAAAGKDGGDDDKDNNNSKAEKEEEEKIVLADMGIMLDHRYWGQGYGLEILIGLVEWARRAVGAALFRTETEPGNSEWRALMNRAEVGGRVTRERASYDADKEVLQWRWDAEAWEEAKGRIQAKGRWVEIE